MEVLQEDLKERIDKALDSIREYLISDGGDVRVIQVLEPEMVVELELLGNCESCSMSNMTMKAGIEEVIKRMVPEIKGVVAVNTK